jgi:hypothetical protein
MYKYDFSHLPSQPTPHRISVASISLASPAKISTELMRSCSAKTTSNSSSTSSRQDPPQANPTPPSLSLHRDGTLTR